TFADGKFELPQNNVILAYYGLKINEAMLDELITNMPCLNKRGFFYKSNGEMEKFLQDFEKCDEIFEYAKTHSELLAPLLWGHHGRDKLIAIDRLMLNTNNGKKVLAVSGTLYNNDESAKKYLNSLDDDSKSFYQMFFPTRPFKFGELINIPFGTWNDVRINCSSDSVLEVVLKTNGGDFEYKFDR
ncbi:MAG: hypothetical protein IJM31_07965, partial [Campylobacter sp.]|nr:hypothetical protein [Campylobacter sp.]